MKDIMDRWLSYNVSSLTISMLLLWTDRAKTGCVSDCTNKQDGNYESCTGCTVFASCVGGFIIDDRPCPVGLLWDDATKRCETTSTTCGTVTTDQYHSKSQMFTDMSLSTDDQSNVPIANPTEQYNASPFTNDNIYSTLLSDNMRTMLPTSESSSISQLIPGGSKKSSTNSLDHDQKETTIEKEMNISSVSGDYYDLTSSVPTTKIALLETLVPNTELATDLENVRNNVTTKTPQEPLTSYCCCENVSLINWNSLSPEQLQREIENLKKELLVDEKQLSSSERRKQSMSDDRQSAKSIGYVGIVIIGIFCSVIVLPDIWSLGRYLLSCRRKSCETEAKVLSEIR